jgi:hypothetical protein
LQAGVGMTDAATFDTLRRLPGFNSCGQNEFEAKCPVHEDKKASLSIGIGDDGRILLHCHAGCSTDSILQALGLTAKDLFQASPCNGNGHSERRIDAVYDYTDENGRLSYQVVRLLPKDFRQRQPDGNGGWKWSIKGIKPRPYNLRDLLQADYVFVVEGEKDVEALRRIGITGTCNSGGAGKWPGELNQYFRINQHITIIPDNDEPGRKHAEIVACNLFGKVTSVKVLYLPGLPEKGDVSDWLSGKDPIRAAEELCKLSDAAPEWKPEPEEKRHAENQISGRIRDYVESIEGTFSTAQLYADLGLITAQERTAARQALQRLKGTKIQPHGNHAGQWRIIRGDVVEMKFDNIQTQELDLWLPFDLTNYVQILPGNIIVVTGDPDAGKTAFLLNVIKRNVNKWDCHYFNSEMGPEELYKRLMLFDDFPMKHPHFHAYERSDDFQDVIQPGKYSLNVIDYMEITDEFYLVGKFINDIHKVLGEAVAIIAIQKKSRNSDMPLGAQRALEKPRLAIALNAGSKNEPNRASILKCKNRKTAHSMIGLSRTYKLIAGSEFVCDSPEWR